MQWPTAVLHAAVCSAIHFCPGHFTHNFNCHNNCSEKMYLPALLLHWDHGQLGLFWFSTNFTQLQFVLNLPSGDCDCDGDDQYFSFISRDIVLSLLPQGVSLVSMAKHFSQFYLASGVCFRQPPAKLSTIYLPFSVVNNITMHLHDDPIMFDWIIVAHCSSHPTACFALSSSSAGT